MLTVVVASTNPVKVQSTRDGFRRMFPGEQVRVESISTHSGVNHQPTSDAETRLGAANRARNAARLFPEADYWVGIEGGVEEQNGDLAAFAWIVILSQDQIGKSRTGTFFLPPPVADLVRAGVELGEANDIVFHQANSKQANGAVGLLTGDVIDRRQLYEHAIVLALVAFKNPALYAPENKARSDSD
jgi:inosine/xanthosine triphosphatase